MTYSPPIKDHLFLLNDVLEAGMLSRTERFAEATPDIFEAVLEEAGKFCTSVLAPLRRSGDEQGCRIVDGVVSLPDGYREAYAQFAQAGWTSLALNPEHGGQGLPYCLHMLVDEIVTTANSGFAMSRGLIDGAFHTIERFGTSEQRALWLPQLAAGDVLPTMNLTEPQAGSDLALLRSRAEPREDGTYAVSGSKIFISGGEQNLTENILHLVLAKLPDAPEGSRGISLFLVPKLLADGTRNRVSCSGIEHKMGLNASATCTMNYDEAIGTLLGTPHGGLMAMFTMMNAARLSVGVQGVGACEGAMQIAHSYAAERKQGRAVGVETPAPHTIDQHRDVQRMLRTQKAFAQGGRALALRTALHLDLSHAATEAEARKHHDAITQLLTPVVKAFLTDAGCEAASLGIQVLGGHGYVREWGMEQWLRDIRIAPIYEGTNGIQAADLVGRKLGLHDGQVLQVVLSDMRADLTAASGILPQIEAAVSALDALQAACAQLSIATPVARAEISGDVLSLFGLVALAREWASIASVCTEKQDDDMEFHTDKLETARFYMTRILPRALSHVAVLQTVLPGA